MPMVKLGKWAPDRQQVGANALITALNVLPRRSGYDSMPQLTSADLGTLNGLCRGAFSGRSSSGLNFTVAGTSNRLYVGTTGPLADESDGASPYTVGTNQWWDFALYNNRIIATNYTDAMEEFEVGVSADFDDLSTDAPRAKHIAIVRGFLVAGNIIGQGVNAAAIGTDEAAVQWSAIDNPLSWPQVGTAAASAVQSDFQPLAGDGGSITDVIGGSDYGLIFRDRAVWRMDYEGGDQFFRFTPISENIGCIIPKGAIRVGGITYFHSEEGFYATNGNEVIPVGNDVVDRFFLANIQADTGYRVSCKHFPEWKCIAWLYMGAGASAEICNALILYNPVDDMWAAGEVSAEWLVDVMPFTDSLDSYSDSLDSGVLSAVSLDSLLSASVRKAGGFISGTHALATFDGTPGTATLETSDFEPTPGRVAMVRSVRPVFDSKTGSGGFGGLIGARFRPSDAVAFSPFQTQDASGKLACGLTGRYLRARFGLSGAFEGLHGFDVDARAGGPR